METDKVGGQIILGGLSVSILLHRRVQGLHCKLGQLHYRDHYDHPMCLCSAFVLRKEKERNVRDVVASGVHRSGPGEWESLHEDSEPKRV